MNTQRPVLRLTSELYNKPHLISPQAFDEITSYLAMRNAGMMAKVETVKPNLDQPSQAGKIGLINIHGSLTNKPIESLCGATGTSYAGLLDQMSYLIDQGCKTIVMDISSGGGEAFNCFQTADALRAMADQNGVYVISYVQDCSASAAYALTVMADEVVAHPQGSIGSIGVLVALMNNTKALEKAGLSRTFITAGENKIPFDAEGEFREGFLADIQEQVDDLYMQFCAHVSKYTGLSVEDVKATEASVFRAPKALELGLINFVMTNEEFAEYLQNMTQEQK
jgi:ClpP class serine protease